MYRSRHFDQVSQSNQRDRDDRERVSRIGQYSVIRTSFQNVKDRGFQKFRYRPFEDYGNNYYQNTINVYQFYRSYDNQQKYRSSNQFSNVSMSQLNALSVQRLLTGPSQQSQLIQTDRLKQQNEYDSKSFNKQDQFNERQSYQQKNKYFFQSRDRNLNEQLNNRRVNVYQKKIYQNDEDENERSNEADIIEFEAYHDDNYKHETHLDEFA